MTGLRELGCDLQPTALEAGITETYRRGGGVAGETREQGVDGLGQGRDVEVGKMGGGFSARLLGRGRHRRRWEACRDGGRTRCRTGVADDGAVCGGDAGKSRRPVRRGRERLAAVALIVVVGAEVEGVNARAMGGEVLLELAWSASTSADV